jgi:2-iminobutanoate/2-iminopropanoate deaminase
MAPDNRSWQPVELGDGFLPPAGAYSPGTRAGDLIFVSGQTPRDPATGKLTGGGIEDQCRVTLENLRRILEKGGARMSDVVSVTVYLASEDDWGTFDKVYRTFFEPPFPARAVVGAGLRDILVEISAVARVRG